MTNPNFYGACYAIIENKKGEVLFQKRCNTGFRDGEYQVPAGHIEGRESLKSSVIREAKEELNIDILEQDIEIKHMSHRIKKGDDRVYFDVYFKICKYSGTIKINEPHKCSELKYFDVDNLENEELFGYDVDVIKQIRKGEKFSDLII